MAGPIEWPTFIFMCSFAVGEAAFVWWLADQFKRTRHDMNNALMSHVSPLHDEVDDIKERLIRVEAFLNGALKKMKQ